MVPFLVDPVDLSVYRQTHMVSTTNTGRSNH